MNYFVGFGDFDTHWNLPDLPPEEGDIVFLIGWGRIGPVLIGLFIVGEIGETVAPVIEPAAMYRIKSIAPVPRHLLPDSPEEHKGTEDEIAVLHPVSARVGRELQKIGQEHVKKLPFARRVGEKKEKRQKTPEEFWLFRF